MQPVLNIFISDNEAAEGRVIDAINRQIVEALKDIPAEDAIKLTISLEMENESGLKASDIAGYLGDIRKAVSGYVSRHYEVEMGKEKADILGGNVSKKIRLIVKFNKSNIDPINKITALMKSSDFSGVYLSNKSGVIDVSAVGEAVNNFIKSNPQRAQELRDKYAQRFLFLVGLGSYAEHPLSSYQEALQNLNPYYIQRSIAPVVFQMNELAAMQGGEKPFNWKLPPAQKVPVRVLIQNSAIDNHIEGAADLRYLVEKFSSIQDLMLGHSEQLELTGISDNQLAEIAKEAYALMKEGKMTGNLVMAVGEILTDYQAGRSKKVVEEQTLARIARLNLKDKNLPDRLVIAYEPRWAIGTGLMPTLEEIDSIHATIRNAISRVYGVDTAERVRIIYGGSFSLAKKLDTRKLSPQEEHTRKSDAELILRLRNVDGALIGTASINPEDFARMNSIAQEVYDSKLGKWGIKRKMYMGGNHKAFNISRTYKEFISRNSGIDRRKVEIALAPELSKLNQLVGVYTGDPLEGIVFIDQLKPEEIAGKIFYLRVDFNMPIDDAKAKPNDPSTWIIPDTSRIKATKPDVDFIRQNGGIVVLVTHFEPKGQNLKGPQSVRFMIPVIEETLGIKIKEFVTDVLGREKTRALKRTAPGDVLFLENLRLDPEVAKGEKAKTQAERDAFAKKFYTGVNDANLNAGVVDVTTGFGVAHRPQGSVDGKAPGVPRLGGMLLRDEVLNGIKVMRNAEHPMAIILGGGPKIADKVPMLKNIMLNTMPEGSKIFIYGGASIAFLMAADPSFEAGKSRSLVTEQALAAAREVLELAQELGIEIVLPDDFVVAESLPIDENHIVPMRTVSVSDVSPTEGIYDIGEQALARFRREMLDEEGNPRFMVIFKNGTVGVAEYQQFRNGNTYVDKTIADAGKAGALAGTGGADTRTGLGYSEKEQPGIEEFFDFFLS